MNLVWLAMIGVLGGAQTTMPTTPNPMENNNINPSNFLWFTTPASKWDEALPVGNGRLGGMVFGTVEEERIQLNENTYWSGGPYSTVVKEGYKALPEIQRLVFGERFVDAHNLFGRKLMGYPVEQQKYQSLANLHLRFSHAAEGKPIKPKLLKGGVIEFPTIKGGIYGIVNI